MNGNAAFANSFHQPLSAVASPDRTDSSDSESSDEEIELESAIDDLSPSLDAHATETTTIAEAADEQVYDLTEPEPPRRRAKHPERGAVYSLEFPTQCPQCCSEITTVRVSRLLRTQVSFTSTLPRKGYIIVCPECEGILSAELSGLV